MEENGNEVYNEQVLSEFRNQWQRELQGDLNGSQSIEDQARDLFLLGVDLERKGKCFEAVRHYRRAVQLVPDIEYKIYSQSVEKKKQKVKANDENNKSNQPTSSRRDSSASDEIDNLVELFQQELSLRNQGVCESTFAAGTISTNLHISSLPVEVFLLILKWVVSNDLDFRSLERFGHVCKGFYLLARDQEIWKMACIKVWGVNVSPTPTLTWREMFITRPRVSFNGCYISKINYQRLGENSYQDQFYRPVQIVEYFRLIRFFPDGKMFMMTSSDELQTSINKLKNVQNALNSRDILKGDYHYQDSTVLIVIKKQPTANQKFKRKNYSNNDTLTFFLELDINDMLKKKFAKLTWRHYTISQGLTDDDFDLRSSTKYPPFYFSSVKSFHSESHERLRV